MFTIIALLLEVVASACLIVAPLAPISQVAFISSVTIALVFAARNAALIFVIAIGAIIYIRR